MTDQEMNLEIARWHGTRHQPRITDEDGATYRGAFDYSGDLNAMHRAEKKLTHDEWRIFLGFVMGERTIPKLASMEEFHRAWHATARQRAEALLRTIGKWKN